MDFIKKYGFGGRSFVLALIIANSFGIAIGQVPQIRSDGELRPMTCDEILNPALRTFSIVKVNGAVEDIQRISAAQLREKMVGCQMEEICLGHKGSVSVRICCGPETGEGNESNVCWEISTDGQVNISLVLPNEDEVGIQVSPETGIQLTAQTGFTE
jgi:hypothetical protein